MKWYQPGYIADCAVIHCKALKKVRVGRFGNALETIKKELTIWQKFKHRHIVVLREVVDSEGTFENLSPLSISILARSFV